ncbi:hypothetical protein FVEN_g5700 [Fusarium venenatum]|uniref:RTA1 like protein n=1 Tax=Fusarium venenatum TaxID=56646 RepID=A0A2L2THW6_9HYPO|nr:uncharacterized protein FVRRES_04125 [Fusarium venenatum]KAG8356553.1 hypothetical protein FVEN_g5700 [Fusarium venenatum]CEI67613.1 unnamed protein product [Fusarium venenatum]
MASSDENLYKWYEPSKAAAIAICALFTILTLAQTWRVFRTRHWFGLTIIIGGIFEVVGLAARAYSRDHLSDLGPYIIQILLVLLAPILFVASIYMFLGRLIHASGYPSLSLIPARWLSKIFVLGDIICFLVQGVGGGKLVDPKSIEEAKAGKNIVLAGLGLQVVIFLVFVLCAVVFHYRMASKGLFKAANPKLRLIPMMATLYICSVLVMVRNIYRLIEYEEGEDGYLQYHEWPTYALDVIFMTIIMVLTLGWYSADLKKEDNSFQMQAVPSSHGNA